jgi:hypothetical protein
MNFFSSYPAQYKLIAKIDATYNWSKSMIFDEDMDNLNHKYIYF